eukprot:Colp12_sorted_trinity150504_noHs@23995
MEEFQVVVMAGGGGSRMMPFSQDIPKPLIPIANKPMVWYILNQLEKAGFEEVILVHQARHADKMKQTISEHFPQLRVDLVGVEEDIGTADSLRVVKCTKSRRSERTALLGKGLRLGRDARSRDLPLAAVVSLVTTARLPTASSWTTSRLRTE